MLIDNSDKISYGNLYILGSCGFDHNILDQREEGFHHVYQSHVYCSSH